VILITHDLGVVAAACRRVLVMYAGRIVEQAEAGPLFAEPRHPYTLGLMASVPRWDSADSTMLQAIEGQPPDLTRLPSGCAFHPRCPWRMERCEREVPALFDRPGGGRFACFADVTKPPAAQETTADSRANNEAR
jgi:oligopeptide/dipeptide ABC transporter ATP-binding protein